MKSESSQPIHIVYTLNQAFVNFAAVSVYSVLNSQTRRCHFHFVHDGDLTDVQQRKLRDFVRKNGSDASFHRVHAEFPRDLAGTTTWSIAVLYRLALTFILPRDVNRVIYLDGDTLVRRPLDELADMKLSAAGLGAVPEPHEAIARLGLPLDSAYLNSGVLVIDLDTWRENRTSEQLLELAVEKSASWVYPDQDILATHFAGAWKRLPPEFNVNHRFFSGPSSLPLPTSNPHLVHFSGQGCKPWETHREHPFADEFWAAAIAVRQAGFDLPPRPEKKRRWYQRGWVATYRKHRQIARARRREIVQTQHHHRRNARQQFQRDTAKRFAPEMIVKRGPFAGMRYPQAYSHGSTLAPKLLGTYEAELHESFQRLAENDYRVVIDIGAAEGYYAIGAAMVWPDARVLAYELQREAREAVWDMAIANGVDERVEVIAECMFGDLYQQRALIICDIEGSEDDLLIAARAAEAFADSDFVIETHEKMRPGVSARLRNQFSQTHRVSTIDTIADADRPRRWFVPETSHLSLQEQAEVIAERRGCAMQWLVCESLHAFPHRHPMGADSSRTRAA